MLRQTKCKSLYSEVKNTFIVLLFNLLKHNFILNTFKTLILKAYEIFRLNYVLFILCVLINVAVIAQTI